MSDLDGTWAVERVSGLLPPLYAVTKHIDGSTGTTRVADVVRVPFAVEGLTLRYKGPLSGFVDLLEPDGAAFRGRATFRGREFARFVLRPLDEAARTKAGPPRSAG
jgi:hypothetical protein